MRVPFNESHIEEEALSWVMDLGYAIDPTRQDDEGNHHVCREGNPQTHE